jgi:hypothetical protein
MRRTKAFLLLGMAAAGFSVAMAAGAGAAGNPPPRGIEPVGSSEWPAVAAQLAKNIARDSFTHDFGGVWEYLLPAYQSAVSQSHWNRCQRSHPAVPASVRITKVEVGSAQELAVDLSLVGRRNVQEIELIVQYEASGSKQAQYAVLYTFWLEQGKIWRAVWLSDEYEAYKSGRCYVSPQGSTIY